MHIFEGVLKSPLEKKRPLYSRILKVTHTITDLDTAHPTHTPKGDYKLS